MIEYKEFFKKVAENTFPVQDIIYGFNDLKSLLTEFNGKTGENLRYYLHSDGTIHKHDLTSSVYSGKDLGEVNEREYEVFYKKMSSCDCNGKCN